MVAIVSDCDYEELSQFKWYPLHQSNRCYATTRINGKVVRMHRMIMGFPESDVDHKDNDGLNNVRSNLRVATRSQNIANRKGKGQFKGVSWHKKNKKWVVYITKDYTTTYLGSFTNQEDAAKAYDKAAIELHGEFAHTNFKKEATY